MYFALFPDNMYNGCSYIAAFHVPPPPRGEGDKLNNKQCFVNVSSARFSS